jgi:hypothetical protein
LIADHLPHLQQSYIFFHNELIYFHFLAGNAGRCPAKQPLPLRQHSNNDPLTFYNLKQMPVLLLSETEILSHLNKWREFCCISLA